MAKNINTKTIYIRDNNLEAWDSVQNKGEFINWCLEHKLKEYQKKLEKKNESERK
jgi:hypothetical protein